MASSRTPQPQTAPTTQVPSSRSPSPRPARPTRRRSKQRSPVAADGEPIHAGKEEFAKALKLIAEGKPIRYEGVIGPVSFDEFGDITGPFRLWRIQNGEVTTVGEVSADEVEAIKAGLSQ